MPKGITNACGPGSARRACSFISCAQCYCARRRKLRRQSASSALASTEKGANACTARRNAAWTYFGSDTAKVTTRHTRTQYPSQRALSLAGATSKDIEWHRPQRFLASAARFGATQWRRARVIFCAGKEMCVSRRRDSIAFWNGSASRGVTTASSFFTEVRLPAARPRHPLIWKCVLRRRDRVAFVSRCASR